MNDYDFVPTPQLSDMSIKTGGNPFQMKGLLKVLDSVYSEGMSLNDLQVAFGTIVKKELMESIKDVDEEEAQVVMKYLQKVDYNLNLDNNKVVRKGR